MATLDTNQINELWNNKLSVSKCYNNTVQTAENFHCVKFTSVLEEEIYNIEVQNGLIHTSTLEEIETAVKSELLNIEYKEAPSSSAVDLI